MEKAVIPLTWIFGVLFLAVGLLGFVIGTPLLWFQVDTVHNVIHLVSGMVAFICAGAGYNVSKWWLIIFGLIYGIFAIIGFLNGNDVLGIMQVNQADNYLHLGITVVALAVGLFSPSNE